MNENIFKQMHKMSHKDEMRSKLLIRGVKMILEKKQEEGSLKRLFRKKNKIVPTAWE